MKLGGENYHTDKSAGYRRSYYTFVQSLADRGSDSDSSFGQACHISSLVSHGSTQNGFEVLLVFVSDATCLVKPPILLWAGRVQVVCHQRMLCLYIPTDPPNK